MSPVKHPVSGVALQFDLDHERQALREQLATSQRMGRTLVKNGPLRATLVGMAAGGTMEPHKADGPITVQVLEGTVEFEVEGAWRTLPAGSLLAFGAGVVHAVRSAEGGIFLLTVVSVGTGSGAAS